MAVVKFIGWFVVAWITLIVVNYLATLVTGFVAAIKLNTLGVPPQGVPGIQHYGRRAVLPVVVAGYILGVVFVLSACWLATKYVSTHWIYPVSLFSLGMGVSRERLGRDRDLFGAAGDYFVVAMSNSIGGGVFWTTIAVLLWRTFT